MVGDVAIRITANGSQVKGEMDKIKSQVKQTTSQIDKTVNKGSKGASDTAKKGANDAARGVQQGTEKVRDDVKKTSDEVKKSSNTSSQASKQMGNSFTQAGNRITQAGKNIKKALKTDAALAFAAVGAAAVSFAKQCIDSAIKSESAWKRFGAIIDSQGGDWSKQEKDVKAWARTFSNNMGYAVSDTREASLNLMQFGVSAKNLEPAMKGVAGLAARTGMTEAEASKVVISAMAGRGTQLKKLTGLSVDAYNKCKTEADQLRLLSDLYKQNEIALREHGETTEAQLTRVDNSWSRLKTEIGQSLMPVIKLMADVLWGISEAFINLPDPVKQFISAVLLIGGAISVVIGAVGMLAPGLIAVGKLVGGTTGVIAFMTGPIGIAIAAIIGFAAVLYYLYTTNEDVRNALNGFADWLRSGFASAWESLEPILQGIGSWLVDVANTGASVLAPAFQDIVSSVAPLGDSFKELYGALQQLWAALTGGDTSQASGDFNLLGAVAEALKYILIGLAGFLTGVLSGAIRMIVFNVQNLVKGFTFVVQVATDVANAIQTVIDLFTGKISFEEFGQQILDAFTSTFSGGSLASIVATEISNIASAFMDVGAITSAISSAFTQVIDWFKSVLGIASPGIMAQTMQEEMGNIAQAILNGVGGILGAIGQFAMDLLTSFVGAIMNLPASILGALTQLSMIVQLKLVEARTLAVTLVGSLVSFVVQKFWSIVNGVRMIFTQIVMTIRLRLVQARTTALMLAQMIRQGIVTRFNQIIAKVRTIFQNIVSTIRQRLSNAASAARQKAADIYNGIKNKVAEIPGIVKQEFDKIKDRISSALDNAKNVAVSKISDLVAAVKGALGIASPGFIQRFMMYEFFSLPDIIDDGGKVAMDSAALAATGIVRSWENNMTSLGVQFDAFNPDRVFDTNLAQLSATATSNFGAGGLGIANNTQNSTRISNDDHTTVYNIETVSFNTDEAGINGKQMFYDVLNELSRGGV